MLDSVIGASEQKIPPQLSLKLPPTSDAVVPGGRKEVTHYVQGGNSYSCNGVRSWSWKVSSDSDWIDTSSLYVKLTVTENSGSANVIHMPAYSLIDRLTIKIGGTEVERIDHYGRYMACMYALSDPQEAENTQVSAGIIGEAITSSGTTFGFPLVCGLQQAGGIGKMLPLRYAPTEITCDLCNLATDFATGSFVVTDVQLLCTQYQTDSGLQESIHEHLLSGKSLSVPIQTWLNSSQALSSTTQKVHAGANKARLDKTLITFKATSDVESRDLRLPTGSFELDVSLGSRRVPERVMTSIPDFWNLLSKTVPKGSLLDINRAEYAAQTNAATQKKFIVGIPFERLPNVFGTGTSQTGGDLLSVSVKNAGGCDEVFIFCQYTQVLELKDSEIAVYS